MKTFIFLRPLKDTRERIECYSMEKSAIKPFELTNIESENQESIDTNNQVTVIERIKLILNISLRY